MKKLRSNEIQGMFATIQIMIVLLFRLLSQYVETDTYRKVSLPVFWKDVKPVLSY